MSSNALTKNQMKVVRKEVQRFMPRLPQALAPVPVSGPSGAKKRRQRRRRAKVQSSPVEGIGAGGQYDAAPAVSNAVKRIVGKMQEGSAMSVEGKMMVMAMCNPNGEIGRQSQARITDVAVPQSVAMCPRAFITVVPPFSSISGIPDANITKNWSFLGFSPPTFKSIAVMVACRNAATPSPDQETAIWARFNQGCAIYPLWTPVDTTSVDTANFLVSVLQHDTVEFRFLAGLSRDIQQMRFVGDGILIAEQTSTWLDQGSLVLAQFPTDIAHETRSVNSFQVRASFSIGSQTSTAVSGLKFPIDCSLDVVYPDGSVVNILKGGVLTSAVVASFSAALNVTTIAYRLYSPDGINVGTTSTTATTPVAFFYEPNSGNPRVRINMGTSGSPGAVLSRWIILGTSGNVNLVAENVFSVASNEIVDENVTVWIPPRISQLSMAVADPKYDGESMKAHHGFYAVRRPEAPVFAYTDTASGNRILVKPPGSTLVDNLYYAGGFDGDLIDGNFLTICWNITGISWAHLPIIKNNRFLEFVPMPDSSYAQFCYTVPPLDDVALTTVRQVGEEGPHGYAPDMNFMGGLFVFLVDVIRDIPRYMRGIASTSLAIAEAVENTEAALGVKSWFRSRDDKSKV